MLYRVVAIEEERKRYHVVTFDSMQGGPKLAPILYTLTSSIINRFLKKYSTVRIRK